MHRPSLGIISLILIVGGAVLMARPPNGDPYLGAVSVRAGLVLGALWLALPNIRQAPPWLLYAVGVLALVLILRPRLLLYSLPVAALVAFLGATSSKQRK